MRLVLASASPRRKELLARLGAAFEVIPARVDESAFSGGGAGLVRRLSLAKAQEVAEKLTGDCAVIGADTIVCLGRQTLGKPADAAQAAAMLRLLSGRAHTVYTGVSVVKSAGGFLSARTFVERARVTFRKLSAAQIERYVATGEPMDKAGAYGAQGAGAAFIRHIRGDFHTVVGLPLCRLAMTLEEMGVLGGE